VKHQYVGDINDYRKYGLIRAVFSAGGLRTLVAWMLTRDDNRTDGQTIGYLDQPDRWERFDPVLFNALRAALRRNSRRHVGLIEKTAVLRNAAFYSAIVPDAALERAEWFKDLAKRAQSCDLVFLDPDNGMEVKSRPYGRKNSSKHLFWSEAKALWDSGPSLLIYQHFPRVNRIEYIRRRTDEFRRALSGATIETFSTARVAFFLALQPKHHRHHPRIVDVVQTRWAGQIQHGHTFPKLGFYNS
jgi:hypothetical protein